MIVACARTRRLAVEMCNQRRKCYRIGALFDLATSPRQPDALRLPFPPLLNMTKLLRSENLLHLGAVFTIALLPNVAHGQVTQGSSPDAVSTTALDTVVVTSRKLGERVWEAPASIDVLSATDLNGKNITNANQLNGILPGLVQAPGSGGGGATGLRGLGSSGSTFSVEASVAEYIDGVYLGHYRDYVVPLYDINSIEVIKGTQSTLLGKNASVGAVAIVTNRPAVRPSMSVSYTYSDRVGGNRIDAYVNQPLARDVSARVAFFYSEDHGYYDNSAVGGSGQRLRDLSARLELAYAPAVPVDALFTYEHDDRHAVGQNFAVLSDQGGVLAARAMASGQVNFHPGAPWTQGDASLPLAGTPAGAGAFDDQKADRVNLVATSALGAFKVSSQTAYVAWRTPQEVDLDFLAANFYNRLDIERSRTFSQEIRLQSPQIWRSRWMFGVYGYDNLWDLDRLTSAYMGNVAFPLNGQAHEVFHESTLTGSAFGSVRVELADQLSLLGDFRYTSESKRATIVRTGAGSIGGPSGSLPPIAYTALGRHADPLDSDIGFQYRPVGNALFYLTYGKGSKSGGYQEGSKTAAGSPFRPETAYSIEAGAKVELSSRATLNAAIFDTEVHSFQVVTTSLVGSPPVNQSTVGNADVRSRGVDVSGAVSLNTSLLLEGGLVYDRAVFSQAFLPVAVAGDRLVKAPAFSGRVSLTYRRPLSNGWHAEMTPQLNFASSAYTQPVHQSPDAPLAAAHEVLDLRLSVRDPSNRWTLSLLGTNLTDDSYIIFASAIGGGGSAVGQRAYYGSYGRPRVVAVQLTYAR